MQNIGRGAGILLRLDHSIIFKIILHVFISPATIRVGCHVVSNIYKGVLFRVVLYHAVIIIIRLHNLIVLYEEAQSPLIQFSSSILILVEET